MRYYNSLSSLFEQDFNPGNYPKLMKKIKLKMNSTPSPEGCIKINVDVSKIYTIWFITVGVVGKTCVVILLYKKVVRLEIAHLSC